LTSRPILSPSILQRTRCSRVEATSREALIKSRMRDRGALGRGQVARTPCSWSTQGGAHADIGPKRPGPSKETNIIGLCQVRRLRCCAPCQGTYLGFVATPRIHPHLTQRASRDLIRASLVAWKQHFGCPLHRPTTVAGGKVSADNKKTRVPRVAYHHASSMLRCDLKTLGSDRPRVSFITCPHDNATRVLAKSPYVGPCLNRHKFP